MNRKSYAALTAAIVAVVCLFNAVPLVITPVSSQSNALSENFEAGSKSAYAPALNIN